MKYSMNIDIRNSSINNAVSLMALIMIIRIDIIINLPLISKIRTLTSS
jgi:hypothetical protein